MIWAIKSAGTLFSVFDIGISEISIFQCTAYLTTAECPGQEEGPWIIFLLYHLSVYIKEGDPNIFKICLH